MTNIQIAIVLFHSPTGNSHHNLERMERWIKAAKREGAGVICFPEMNVTGYDISPDIRNVAEPVPGDVTQRLSELATEHDIVILAGIAEKGEKGRIFASHLVVKPDGRIGVYRKLHIAPPEHNLFSSGNQIPLFETKEIRFGIQLCYDAHFPELSTYMALKGAELIIIPHASPRGTPEEKYRSWLRHLPARAYDNSLFVIAYNQCGENGKGLSFPGIAMVIDPLGNIIEKDISGTEGMIVTELKREMLESVRNHKMRFFLPNRRADIYD